MLGKFRLIDLSVPLEHGSASEPVPATIRYASRGPSRGVTLEARGIEYLKANETMLRRQAEYIRSL
jgi:hypothetical protein